MTTETPGPLHSAEKAVPKELFVVIDDEGDPDYASTISMMAHDHINDYAGDAEAENVDQWVVRRYVLADQVDDLKRLLRYATEYSSLAKLFNDEFLKDAAEALK